MPERTHPLTSPSTQTVYSGEHFVITLLLNMICMFLMSVIYICPTVVPTRTPTLNSKSLNREQRAVIYTVQFIESEMPSKRPFCNKVCVPNAEVMHPSVSTSEPLEPDEGRVRRPIGRAAQLIHTRLSSFELNWKDEEEKQWL